MTETRLETAAGDTALAARPAPALDRLLGTDHKRVGLNFLWASLGFLVVGGVAAGLLRADTAMPDSGIGAGAVFAQAYSLHATSSVFLFLLPAWIGLGLYMVPLQIGARGVAFPRLAALSFWVYLVSGLTLAASYLVDEGGATGLPVGDRLVTASDGADLMILGLVGVSVAFVLAAVVLVTTIARMRAPGVTLWRVPAFTWAILASGALLLLATPVSIAGLALLYLSTHHGGHVFDPADGDFAVLWQHLLWFYGRPDLWVLVLPAFGVVSEVVPVFGRRPLRDHRVVVAAFGLAVPLAFGAWAYEIHALGGKALLPFFSVPAALIAAPLGLLVLLWLGTMAGARPSFESAPLFALGMVLTIALAVPLGVVLVLGSDVPLEQTQFLAGHVHLFLFVPPVLGLFAGLFYWAPKLWGRHLSEGLGRLQLLLMLGGAVASFVPMYLAGLQEMPAGVSDYATRDAWQAWSVLSALGTVLFVLGVIVFLANVASSVGRGRGRAAVADPWEGNTLEWVADSPPAPGNFAWLPDVRSASPAADLRTTGPGGAEGAPGGTPELEPAGTGAAR